MPEISAAPAAPVAPTAAVTPAAANPKDGTAATAESGGFLTQLKAALLALGGGETPASAPTVAAPTVEDADSGALAEEMPELLAALGLVPVPVQMTMVVPQLPSNDGAAAIVTDVNSAGLAATLPVPLTAADSIDGPLDHGAPAQALPQAPAAASGANGIDLAQLPTSNVSAPDAAAAALASSPEINTAQPRPQLQPQAAQASMPAEATAHVAAAEAQPAATDVPGTPPAGDAAARVGASTQAGLQQHAGESRDGNAQRETTHAIEAVDSRTDAPTAAPAAAAAPTTATAAPTSEVRPTHVVGQIANQAELYRLPGGRGVRIQLNPDGLGGVQVTLRYAPTGQVELHMTIEQSATADLVQAGWGELRDALALQGINPERLVMSVSTPSGSTPHDSGRDGARADFGQAGSGQPGQQRNDPEGGRAQASGGWLGRPDATSASDDDQRPASAHGSSRIDYRA